MVEAIGMIRQSAKGIADRRDLSRVRKLRFDEAGFDRGVWSEICELGWPGLRIPEAQGGVGLPLAAYCALAEELGSALVPEPLIAAVLASAFLTGTALERQLSGGALYLPVWQTTRDCAEPGAEIASAGGLLSGEFNWVTGSRVADGFVIVGRNGAWLIEATVPGLHIEVAQTQDGGGYGRLRLEGVPAEPLGPAPTIPFAEACLATSAYLLGLADAAIERTVDYLASRVQFGKAIGTFQALQHRMVDLKLETELTRASIEEAAQRWDCEPASERSLAAVSRAKVRAASTALLVTKQAIQLHGGIGFTDEHDISLFLRKAMVVGPQFGSATLHRDRYASLQPYRGS